jgi:hypothetical protein
MNCRPFFVCMRSSNSWIKAFIPSASISSKPRSSNLQSISCSDFHIGPSSFGEFSIIIPDLKYVASEQNNLEVSIDEVSSLKFHNLNQLKLIGQFVEDRKGIFASSQVHQGRTLFKAAQIQAEVGELGASVHQGAIWKQKMNKLTRRGTCHFSTCNSFRLSLSHELQFTARSSKFYSSPLSWLKEQISFLRKNQLNTFLYGSLWACNFSKIPFSLIVIDFFCVRNTKSYLSESSNEVTC